MKISSMESLVSIIVPYYNIPEAYVRQCLDSLCRQTYPYIEILVVDDGSTADNAKMLDELSETDSRIKVFHKSNGGVSSARNHAMANAGGDYICFVDSDDWVEPEFVEGLVRSIEKDQAQIAVCNWIAEIDGVKTDTGRRIEKTAIYNMEEAYHSILCSTEIQGFLCNKIFCKNLVTQRLNENYHYCEDLVFVSHYLKNVSRMSYNASQLYHYRQTTGNATGNMSYNDKILSLLPAYREVERICASLNLADLPSVRKNVLKIALNLMARYKLNRVKDREVLTELTKIIRSYLPGVLRSDSISMAEKANIVMTRVLPVFMFRIKCKLLKRSVG